MNNSANRNRLGWTRRLRIIAVVSLIVGGSMVAIAAIWGPRFFANGPAAANDDFTRKLNASVRAVKTVRPRRTASVPIMAENIATVEPYYLADLRARASGIIRRVHRDIGDKVRAGDVLIEIDVPESDQEVAKAEATIFQRQQEVKVSEAKLKDSKAAKDVSAATVRQRIADVDAASATRDLKKHRFARFQELAARGSVVGSLVEEEERDYLASEATVTSVMANVERARADFAESESKVEAAEADIELKKAQVVVARKELERAKAIAEYSRVAAPFDGVVVRRNVDPGSFVQNATTGASEALISVARVDLVTVSARFPDSVAPHVRAGTEATVRIDDLPGVSITAKVTRYSPSVQNADHTMRVEIDLFNGSEEEHGQLVEMFKSGVAERGLKGSNDPMPLRAFEPSAAGSPRLIPGMSGSMKLNIGGFSESYVLPSAAIYSRSGTNYVLLVENGKTRQVPVRVQMNDGKTVLAVMLEKRTDARGNGQEILVGLKGHEEVVVARQLEVGDNASVTSHSNEW